jgi:hypothetical protein
MLYILYLFISLVSFQAYAEGIPSEKELFEELGVAIGESDLHRFKKIFPKVILTQQERKFCLDLAHEMIELRRNNMINFNASNIDRTATWMCLISALWLVIWLRVAMDLRDRIPAFISLIGVPPLIYYYIRSNKSVEKEKEERADRWGDAVIIKQYFQEES